jgi:phosphohistidine phosphatase
MKKLIIVRHARAEDSLAELTDFERSLTVKGKTVAGLMTKKLCERENTMGTMISSPAFRALETAIIFATGFGVAPETIIMNSNLYYKMSLRYLTEYMQEISDDTDTLSLFGHNPSFSEIADSLSRDGSDILPKCGIVCISFNIKKWSEVKQHTGKLEYFLKPEK